MIKIKNLKDTAYNYIKNEIVNCRLMPGALIDEKKLIEEFNFSRTPIREALNALATEGLIDVIPRRGIFVAPITMKDINDIFTMERYEDAVVVRLCIGNVSREMLLKYREQFISTADPKEYTRIDMEFHQYLLELTNNKYLIKMVNSINDLAQRIRVLTGLYENRMEHSRKEHVEIIDRLLAGDVENAVKAMENHFELARKSAIALISDSELRVTGSV